MDKLTVEKLKKMAKNLDISCINKYKKTELIREIKKAQMVVRNRVSRQRATFIIPIINDVWVMYTKEGCGYCKKAKELFESKGISPNTMLVTLENKDAIFRQLDQVTNKYRTFPMIFKNDKFIGGYSELVKII